MRLLGLVLALCACSKSPAPRADPDLGPGKDAGAAAVGADCAKLEAPVTRIFARMGTQVELLEAAFRDAGSDCEKLRANLTAIDTDDYLATMTAVAAEMQPLMTPACEAHLDKLGDGLETTFRPRFEKVLAQANVASNLCADAPVRAAIEASLRVFKKKQ